MSATGWRPNWGLDGEGRDINGRHRYTYLYAWCRPAARGWSLRNHRSGLTTEQCLMWLTDLPTTRRAILSGFYFSYDTTMILTDLSDEDKKVLHAAGWVVWPAPTSGQLFYIEWHPGKSLFVGRLDNPVKEGERPRINTWRWRGKHWCHIEDASGYSQKSFAKTIAEWDIIPQERLEWLEEMKGKRGEFDQEDPKEIERYCQMECALLAEYVASVQACTLAENIKPQGWHGPGAIASALLRREGAHKAMGDPPEDSPAREAVMCSYFGGRSENFVVGHVPVVYNNDIRSAYPAALLHVPDLKHGHWEARSAYTREPWALWHVRWEIPPCDAHVMPFPFRSHGRVWYPYAGTGWYHARVVAKALELYPNHITVTHGFSYLPDDALARPFEFVEELGAKRVHYKDIGDRRERILKLALNSLYGKLAQHELKEGKRPPFQCYYAAGFVTSWTQAELLHAIYSDGHDGRDVVGVATDGLFTQSPRAYRVGSALGEWEVSDTLHDVMVVQPGVYYASDGHVRSRGFRRESLDYDDVRAAWERSGICGEVSYTERRFVGLGYCCGTGDFANYGQWVENQRIVSFMPGKSYDHAHERMDIPYYRLHPVTMQGESEAYTPERPLDDARGQEYFDDLLELWWHQDQPH